MTGRVETSFPRPLTLLVAAAYFMEMLDGTIVAPAAPRIAADLGVQPVDVGVTISAYVLTLGVLIPISGWLADRFGTRPVFCTALGLFVVASIGCAFAPNLLVLTAARIVQGAGGALMVPVGRLVVLRATATSDLVRAIAYLTWPALVAPVVAPLAGGLLAEYASWRWIFLVNVPLGAVALVVALRLVRNSGADAPPPLDRRGFVLTALGVAALIVGLDGLGDTLDLGTLAALVVSGVVLTVAVRHLLRAEHPLVDLRILRVPSFGVATLSGSVYRATIIAIPVLLPLLFQVGFGWTPTEAGALVIALFAGNLVIKPATTPLMRRFGIRGLLLVSIGVGMVCLAGMAFLTKTTPLWLLLPLLLVSGIVRSTGFTAYNSVTFADVDSDRMTGANTLNSTLQQLGAGLGVALGAVFARAALLLPVHLDAAGPYRVALGLLAVVLVVPAISALRLAPDIGDHVTGRR